MENTVQSTAIDSLFVCYTSLIVWPFIGIFQCHVQIYIVNKCHNQNTIMFRLFYYKIMSRKIIIQQKGIQNLTRQLVFFQPHSLLSFKMVHNVAFHILFSG